MKDYFKEYHKYEISIPKKSNLEIINNYKLNKTNQTLIINYSDGTTGEMSYSESAMSLLSELQKYQLEKQKEEIYPKLSAINATYETISIVSTLSMIYLLGLGIGTLGAIIFPANLITAFIAGKTYKLKREMELVSWIIENKEEVDKFIRSEVHSKVSLDKTNLNPTFEYPTESVPYPETMYESGIDLNNIDSLSVKQLSKIKRKIEREKQNKRK